MLLRHYLTGQRPGTTPSTTRVRCVDRAHLPTRHGDFALVGYSVTPDHPGEAVAIVRGDVRGREDVPVRVHSECLTGDAFGSTRCDCRDQLEAALDRIGDSEVGIVVYLRQEGRGIGLLNKVRAYALQDQGLDTVDANLALGLPEDARNYAVAARILEDLGVRSVQLMTNNPDKIGQLEQHGVRVSRRISHIMPPTRHNRRYLDTKARRQGHLLPLAEVAAK